MRNRLGTHFRFSFRQSLSGSAKERDALRYERLIGRFSMGLKASLRQAMDLALIVGICAFGSEAVGQESHGTIAGQVIGPNGEEVAKAPIAAKNTETGNISKTTININ